MKNAYIVDGVRTAIGNLSGGLSEVRADDLAAHAIARLVARHPTLDPAEVTDVILGCANQAGEDNRNVARMASLLAGLPVTVPGETVNRLCASGMSAVASAARSVKIGEGEVYIAGGVESMTRAPYVMSKAGKPFARDIELFDTSLGWRFVNPKMKAKYGTDSMGETAENVAEQYKITRGDQDAFALRSQQKAAEARATGRLAREIVAVEIPQRKGGGDPKCFDQDEFLRPDSTLEILAKLKPAFRASGGSVTAGNSSQMSDGAGAVLLASEKAIKDYGLTPLARFVGFAVAGVPPEVMGIGPKAAIPKVCAQTGIKQDDLDWIELNEAFAAQALAVIKDIGLNPDKINPLGGAIALGHPLGATGAVRIATLINGLRRRKQKYGMVTMCIGTGMGAAGIFEAV